MAQSNAISPFILSVSDQVEKGIADIKYRLGEEEGELAIYRVQHNFHLAKYKNTDLAANRKKLP